MSYNFSSGYPTAPTQPYNQFNDHQQHGPAPSLSYGDSGKSSKNHSTSSGKKITHSYNAQPQGYEMNAIGGAYSPSTVCSSSPIGPAGGGSNHHQQQYYQQQHQSPQMMQETFMLMQQQGCNGKNHTHNFEGDLMYGSLVSQNPELSRFKIGGYKDFWAAVLFYIQFIVCIGLAVWNLVDHAFSNDKDKNNNAAATSSTTTAAPPTTTTTTLIPYSNSSSSTSSRSSAGEIATVFAEAAAAGFGFATVLTIIFLFLIKMYPIAFIWIANGFVVLLFFGLGILCFATGDATLGVLGIIFGLFVCVWLYFVRHRIPFSALLLECGASAALRFHGTVFCAFVALILAGVHFAFWIMMTVPTIAKLQPSQSSSNGGNNNNTNSNDGTIASVLLFVFLLMLFWTSQVAQGVVHCTAGGTVATWYFVGNAEMPPNPAWASFKRAMSTSFGSIAFGSLIVAILKTIEAMVRGAGRRNRNVLAMCILQCIRRLMEYFNTYAFSFIAIYGCSYIEAAKETFNMIKNGSIWSGVISNILVDRVFVLCSCFEAAVCGLLCYLMFKDDWLIAILAGVLMGFVVSTVIFNTVASSVTTLIVCVADAPEVFVMKHPEMSQKINKAISEMRKGCCDNNDDEDASGTGGGGGGNVVLL